MTGRPVRKKYGSPGGRVEVPCREFAVSWEIAASLGAADQGDGGYRGIGGIGHRYVKCRSSLR